MINLFALLPQLAVLSTLTYLQPFKGFPPSAHSKRRVWHLTSSTAARTSTPRAGTSTSSLSAGLHRKSTSLVPCSWQLWPSSRYPWPQVSVCHCPPIPSCTACPLHSLLTLSSPLLGLNAGLVGLGLTYTISLAGIFQYCIRLSAEVENVVSACSSHYDILAVHTSMASSWFHKG